MQTALQASNQMSLLALFIPVTTLPFTFFLLLFFLKPHTPNAPEWIVAGQAVITFIMCIVTWIRVQKDRLFYWCAPDPGDIKRHLRYGWALLPTFLVGYITMWGNYSILQAYYPSYEVGLFGAAYQVILGIISLNGIWMNILLPRLIAKNAETKSASRDFFDDIIPTLFCLWALAAVAFIAVIPSLFNTLFGKQFIGSQAMLIILLIAIPTSMLPHAYSILLTIQQRLGRVFIYSLVGMVVTLAISFSLIPAMGGLGAAVGSVAALLAGQLLYIWDQHRFMNTSMRLVGTMFTAILLLCVFQYFIGAVLWARLLWGASSIYLLILLFRKLKVINSNLLTTMFSGRLSGIGVFLNRLLTAGQ
jgi:O-antigen/teichoic acid export membrane protein